MPAIKRIRHSFAKMLCIIAAISVLDAHLAIMQGWAWVCMLNDRIPVQGLEQAIDTTFSGEYPCEQCKAIAEQRAKEQKQEPIPELKLKAKSPLALLPNQIEILLSPVCKRLPYTSFTFLPPLDVNTPILGPPPKVFV